jgi:hypothetical protein
MVGQFISLLQDTTLLSLIGLMELLGTARTVMANPAFLGRNAEVYFTLAVLFWCCCAALGLGSRALERRLDPSSPGEASPQIHVDQPAFFSMMATDPMASDKLTEGIQGFCKAIETLEAQLAHRLAVLEGGAAFSHAVHEIFLLNDLDGDGCITREEWLGSDAVFDALDTDKDGRLAPDDVRGGLGAALAISR